MPSSWSLSAPSGFGPELKACHVFLDAGDTLVVPSLDRYGRSLQDLINMVAELRERGIGFTSLHENLDTTTPGGRLVFHVFAALAEFIRELIIIGARVGSRRGVHLTTVATCGFRCCLTPLADGSVSRTASFPTTSATWQPSDPGDLAQCDCGAIGTEKMSIKIESRW